MGSGKKHIYSDNGAANNGSVSKTEELTNRRLSKFKSGQQRLCQAKHWMRLRPYLCWSKGSAMIVRVEIMMAAGESFPYE